MSTTALFKHIQAQKSYLCVGLDIDLDKVPQHLLKAEDPIFEFAKAIIDATAPYAVAFKPNFAFFETYGVSGWQALEKTIRYIKTNYPKHFAIADAKRGDIGNTATRYAKAFFEQMNFDAVTIAPYMGRDAVEPFLAFDGKYGILLALTSNPGAADFQKKTLDGKPLFTQVLATASSWDNAHNLMYVVGATQAEALHQIRAIVPNAFLLVPGVGAQGGDLNHVFAQGHNAQCGLLVNASRSIIYAGSDEQFASAAAQQALQLQQQMEVHLTENNLI
jgi:orotidine-5'-phosphate decarboxylase